MCRQCPDGTTSPLGSTSKTACICLPGQYLGSCLGDIACEDAIGREDFEYLRFADLSNLLFRGNATIAQGNSVRLTPSLSNTMGQLFYMKPIDLQVVVEWGP